VFVLDAVARQHKAATQFGSGRRESNEGETKGFGRGCAARTHDAGDTNSNVSAKFLARIAGKFPRNCIADCAVLQQQIVRDIEQALFGFIRIGDNTAQKIFGTAGDVGNVRRDESAGTGFGKCELEVLGAQKITDGDGELICFQWRLGWKNAEFFPLDLVCAESNKRNDYNAGSVASQRAEG
jgi:hypothetical protein